MSAHFTRHRWSVGRAALVGAAGLVVTVAGVVAVSSSVGAAPRSAPSVAITTPAAWQEVKAGQSVQLSASLSNTATSRNTCRIVWDDGSSDSLATKSTCARSHSYAQAGMYTVRVTATDSTGASGDAKVLVVVTDPNAGWVNIDGSTPTPLGSITSDPKATSSTWLHLDARYYPGRSTPTGEGKAWTPQTSFRMEGQKSTLQWLVVTPNKLVAAKGTVVRDGTTYGFVIYGRDGSPDAVRVVAWNQAAGQNPGAGTVIDTARGSSYDIDQTALVPMDSGQALIQH